MLKWLKDALVQHLVEEVRRNALRYDKIISELQAQNRTIKQLDRKVSELMATQEEQLQQALQILNTVSTGVTEIINRLNNVPGENPAIQDEIDGVKAVAQNMADQINAVLNPPGV